MRSTPWAHTGSGQRSLVTGRQTKVAVESLLLERTRNALFLLKTPWDFPAPSCFTLQLYIYIYLLASCTWCKTDARLLVGQVCCICLARYVDNDDLRLLPCGHFFHKDCVDKWLKINALCPLCKAEIDVVPRTAPPAIGFGRRDSHRRVGNDIESQRLPWCIVRQQLALGVCVASRRAPCKLYSEREKEIMSWTNESLHDPASNRLTEKCVVVVNMCECVPVAVALFTPKCTLS